MISPHPARGFPALVSHIRARLLRFRRGPAPTGPNPGSVRPGRFVRLALPAVVGFAALAQPGPAVAQMADGWPTRGGEGGREIVVDTLADSGPGTLRAALAQEGARVVRFAVGGEIWLSRPLEIDEPFVTVDAGDAPAPGISVMGDKVRIRTHDVILRHLRVRVGELAGGSDPDNRDGIALEGDPERPFRNILIDHCSIAWAVDEGLQLWGAGGRDVAVTNSIIAETLSRSIHPKGAHSLGFIVGPRIDDVLIAGNLMAHNNGRNPVIAGGSSAIVMNNLVYNPGFAAFHVYRREGEPPTRVSAVGNLVIAGPNTQAVLKTYPRGVNPGTQIYFAGNEGVDVTAFDPNEPLGGEGGPSPISAEKPIWREGLSPVPAEAVLDSVLTRAGARPDLRDETDRRIVAEVRARGGGIRDAPADARLARERPLETDED